MLSKSAWNHVTAQRRTERLRSTRERLRPRKRRQLKVWKCYPAERANNRRKAGSWQRLGRQSPQSVGDLGIPTERQNQQDNERRDRHKDHPITLIGRKDAEEASNSREENNKRAIQLCGIRPGRTPVQTQADLLSGKWQSAPQFKSFLKDRS